ncbi:hypothetical protein LINGRAHAP2_LOCUS6025 [Linum grandiflorum]
MKPLLPPSKMYSSRSSTTSGCISGLLTRILCSRTAPTHPSSDPISDTNLDIESVNYHPIAPPPPGIIARLMGLEQPDGDSICRSRSMDSIEFGKAGIDEKKKKKKHHRRVKSTMSLTENDNFLVFTFESRGNRGDGKTDKPEFIEQMVSRILTEESAVRDRFSGDEISPPSRDAKKKIRSAAPDEEATECCSSSSLSEDASPVSVLDSSRQFSLDHEVSSQSEDSETEPSETNGFPRQKLKKFNLNRIHPDLWEDACKMAEDDAVEGLNSNGMPRSKHGHFEIEMVGAELEWHILDQLLDELVVVQQNNVHW